MIVGRSYPVLVQPLLRRLTLRVKLIRLSEIFFFKQKTAYEMRISDWSSDVCSSDLLGRLGGPIGPEGDRQIGLSGELRGEFRLEGQRLQQPAVERQAAVGSHQDRRLARRLRGCRLGRDRTRTRLNSSH